MIPPAGEAPAEGVYTPAGDDVPYGAVDTIDGEPDTLDGEPGVSNRVAANDGEPASANEGV